METDLYNNFTTLKATLGDGVLQITIDDFSLNLNVVDYQRTNDLLHLIDLLKYDQQVKVVVFHSTNPDFFLVKGYMNPTSEDTIDPLHFQLWAKVLMGLAILPQTKVAIVEDKVKDVGNGFLLACDLTIHCSMAGRELLSINLQT